MAFQFCWNRKPPSSSFEPPRVSEFLSRRWSALGPRTAGTLSPKEAYAMVEIAQFSRNSTHRKGYKRVFPLPVCANSCSGGMPHTSLLWQKWEPGSLFGRATGNYCRMKGLDSYKKRAQGLAGYQVRHSDCLQLNSCLIRLR